MSIKTIEETFNCPVSPHLSLSNIRGSVKIQAGEDGVISVIGRKHLNTGDEENTHIELAQSSDGTVKVSTRYTHKGLRLIRKWVPCKVDYEIRVPEESALKVRGVSNSTMIKGITGTHDISSVSGDVELCSLAGEIRLKVVNGDAKGELISGSVQLNSVSGDIKLKSSDISKITGKTVSGDLTVESPLGDGPYDFNAVSGDIKLRLPSLRGATVTSSSLSGDVRSSLPTSQSNHNRNHRRIEIYGGGVEIHHNSVSGDIFLVGENNSVASRNLGGGESWRIER
jgi:DUF4097 and DUF4098 domain-containing protein YvlB